MELYLVLAHLNHSKKIIGIFDKEKVNEIVNALKYENVEVKRCMLNEAMNEYLCFD